MSSLLTPADKTLLLNDAVYYEVLFALGVSAHDPTDYCAWEHQNYSRMGHARALLYFFERRCCEKKWQDDVVSEEFGFPAAPLAIEKGERNRLNKDLFHLSSQRLRHTSQSNPWTNVLLQQVHDRSVEFIEHLLSSQPGRDFEVTRPQWEMLAAALKSGKEVQIGRHFKTDGSDSGWMIREGRRLTSGKSELTVCLRTL